MDILHDPLMFPFMVSVYLLVGLVALEVVLLVLGADAFHFIDDLIPDLGEADAPETLSLAKALGFIGIGKVPVLMVLMSFLAIFGAGGYLIQKASAAFLDGYLPLAAAVPLAGAAAILLTGRFAALLARVLPSEETSAVSKDSLIGRKAVMNFGDATFTRNASAKVTDRHGNVHYVQVMASSPEELLPEGSEITLVSRHKGFFIGTPVPSSEA